MAVKYCQRCESAKTVMLLFPCAFCFKCTMGLWQVIKKRYPYYRFAEFLKRCNDDTTSTLEEALSAWDRVTLPTNYLLDNMPIYDKKTHR